MREPEAGDSDGASPDAAEGSPRGAGGDEALVVVAALAERPGPGGEPEVFLARRAPLCRDAGAWELPGGKVEKGEEPAAALRREIREELGVDAVVGERASRYECLLRGRRAVFLVFPARFEGEPGLRGSHDAMSYFPARAALELELAPLDRPALEAWISSRTGPGPSPRRRCGA